jgi:hypothetical protein
MELGPTKRRSLIYVSGMDGYEPRRRPLLTHFMAGDHQHVAMLSVGFGRSRSDGDVYERLPGMKQRIIVSPSNPG